ncbi:MAG: YaaC family protein [Myxococcota bacterium]
MRLHYVGSFQRGHHHPSESAAGEAWGQLSRYGAVNFLSAFSGNIGGEDPDRPRITSYAAVRIRQGVEFRSFSQDGSLLTAPLSLYYAALNAARACLALETGTESGKSHGLTFRLGESLMDCHAIIAKGTYADLLAAFDVSFEVGDEISLRDALSAIPEIAHEFNSPDRGLTNVYSVSVKAARGELTLRVNDSYRPLEDFAASWRDWFPILATICAYNENERSLALVDAGSIAGPETVEEFCNAHLETSLTWLNAPIWWLIRHPVSKLELPRIAYYFVALFILGSVVRYEPEMMIEAASPDDELNWFLQRFLAAADRHVPQLLVSRLRGHNVFFPSV